MNPLSMAITVILAAVILACIYVMFTLVTHVRSLGSAVSDNLARINNDVAAHLKDSLRLINEAHHTLGSRLDNATQAVSHVRQHLGKLEESQRRLYEVGRDIATLQDLLRAPKIRGGIGEFILEDLLKQVIPPGYYSLQYQFKSKERVDAAIRFGAGLVPVDAKFPLENFKKMSSSHEDQEYRAHKKRFVNDVKIHIKKIADKYILPDEGTFDFALMYIPAENVYYEIIVKDETSEDTRGLFQYALDHKVIPVSPNSFYAYLRVILLGLRGMAVEKGAQEILANLGRIRGDVGRFAQDFGKIGRHLDNARGSYGESEKRLIRLQDKLQGIELPAIEEIASSGKRE